MEYFASLGKAPEITTGLNRSFGGQSCSDQIEVLIKEGGIVNRAHAAGLAVVEKGSNAIAAVLHLSVGSLTLAVAPIRVVAGKFGIDPLSDNITARRGAQHVMRGLQNAAATVGTLTLPIDVIAPTFVEWKRGAVGLTSDWESHTPKTFAEKAQAIGDRARRGTQQLITDIAKNPEAMTGLKVLTAVAAAGVVAKGLDAAFGGTTVVPNSGASDITPLLNTEATTSTTKFDTGAGTSLAADQMISTGFTPSNVLDAIGLGETPPVEPSDVSSTVAKADLFANVEAADINGFSPVPLTTSILDMCGSLTSSANFDEVASDAVVDTSSSSAAVVDAVTPDVITAVAEQPETGLTGDVEEAYKACAGFAGSISSCVGNILYPGVVEQDVTPIGTTRYEIQSDVSPLAPEPTIYPNSTVSLQDKVGNTWTLFPSIDTGAVGSSAVVDVATPDVITAVAEQPETGLNGDVLVAYKACAGFAGSISSCVGNILHPGAVEQDVPPIETTPYEIQSDVPPLAPEPTIYPNSTVSLQDKVGNTWTLFPSIFTGAVSTPLNGTQPILDGFSFTPAAPAVTPPLSVPFETKTPVIPQLQHFFDPVSVPETPQQDALPSIAEDPSTYVGSTALAIVNGTTPSAPSYSITVDETGDLPTSFGPQSETFDFASLLEQQKSAQGGSGLWNVHESVRASFKPAPVSTWMPSASWRHRCAHVSTWKDAPAILSTDVQDDAVEMGEIIPTGTRPNSTLTDGPENLFGLEGGGVLQTQESEEPSQHDLLDKLLGLTPGNTGKYTSVFFGTPTNTSGLFPNTSVAFSSVDADEAVDSTALLPTVVESTDNDTIIGGGTHVEQVASNEQVAALMDSSSSVLNTEQDDDAWPIWNAVMACIGLVSVGTLALALGKPGKKTDDRAMTGRARSLVAKR